MEGQGKVSNVRRGPKPAQETPVARIIREASAAGEVTDAQGRKLTFKRPGALEKLRLFKAIGPENSQNQMYLGYAMIAISVTSIAGEAVDPCKTERHVEALVQELGDDGINAVGEALGRDGNDTPEELAKSAEAFT